MKAFDEIKLKYPVNLQLFAEGEDAGNDDSDSADVSGDQGEDQTPKSPSLEELLKDENFLKDFQSHVDKRVTDAVKKTTKKLKEQFEEEQRRAQMTEEERKKELEKQLEQEAKKRELEIRSRELKLELIDILEAEQLDTGFRDLIDVSAAISIEDQEEARKTLETKVKKVKELFTALVDKKVEEVKNEYLKGKTPELKHNENNPPLDEYQKALKRGDVRGMIASKFKNKTTY